MPTFLLALLAQMLRQQMRSPIVWWTRAAFLGLTLFALLISRLMESDGAVGLSLFVRLMEWNCGFLAIGTLGYFASAITEEKEAGTLGLLEISGIPSTGLLLGKFVTRLLAALLLLMAQVPFMLLAITLGGIALPQILAGYIVMSSQVILLASLGLFFSVLCRSTGLASIFVGISWIGLILTPVCREIFSPFPLFKAICSTGFTGPILHTSTLLTILGSAFLFVAANVAFAWIPRDDTSAQEPTWTKRRLWAPKTRPMPFRALEWKDYHFLTGGHIGVVLRLAVALALAILCRLFFPWPGSAFAGIGCITLILFVDIAIVAGKIYRDEIDNQTLATLELIPGELKEKLKSKSRGTRHRIPPMVFAAFGFPIICHLDHLTKTPEVKVILAITGGVALVALYARLQAALCARIIHVLSLRMKRGAIALGIAIDIGANLIASVIPPFGFISGTIVALVMIPIFDEQILKKTEAVIAED